MIVLGDMNINLLIDNNMVSHYTNVVQANGFSVLNKIDSAYATRIAGSSRTILDHVLTNVYDFEYYLKVIEPHISDHKGLIVGIHLRLPKVKKFHYKDILRHTDLRDEMMNSDFSTISSFVSLSDTIKEITDRHKRTIRFIQKKQ